MVAVQRSRVARESEREVGKRGNEEKRKEEVTIGEKEQANREIEEGKRKSLST